MKKIVVLSMFFLLFCVSVSFAGEKTFEIVAKKFSYTPNIIKVNKGDIVTVRLLSEDVTHGFYLDGYELETSARPGLEGSLTFVADKAGKFDFRCSVTCGEFHPYMIGYLIVGPNSRFLGFAALILFLAVASFLIMLKSKKESGDVQG